MAPIFTPNTPEAAQKDQQITLSSMPGYALYRKSQGRQGSTMRLYHKTKGYVWGKKNCC